MPSRRRIAIPLVLLATVSFAGCQGDRSHDEKSRPSGRSLSARLTSEEARKALLALESLRVVKGGPDDPIHLDLKNGDISRIDELNVRIGQFISVDLKKKTWQMSMNNGQKGRSHYSEGLSGVFEIQPDGSWVAIRKGGWIT